MQKCFLLVFLFLPLLGFARKVPFETYFPENAKGSEIEAPWFTGPLLAPSAVTIPVGHWDIETYFSTLAITGRYNRDWRAVKTETFWSHVFQPDLQVGITSWLDASTFPTFSYNYTQGVAEWVVGDVPISFGVQLYKWGANITDWTGGLKFIAKETFPTGKYQNLNPKKWDTDLGGTGSWQTSVGLVWSNLFYLGGNRFISWRTFCQYTLPSSVHVKNFNLYGGGWGTRGTVYPAQNWIVDMAFELSLTQQWVFAIDLFGSWSSKTRFKGRTLLPMTAPSKTQFSLAPAIEYNWNTHLGIILGPWFTIAGRNAVKFTNSIFALNYYY